MRRVLALVSAAIVMAAPLTACGGSASKSSTKQGGVDKITVGVIPIVDVAPIYLGKQKGFFAQQKIDPTLQPTSGGAAIVPGVVSGKFTFGFSNVVSLLVAKERGLPLKIVANGDSSSGKAGHDFGGVLVHKNSPIKTAKALAGKRVSINNLQNV